MIVTILVWLALVLPQISVADQVSGKVTRLLHGSGKIEGAAKLTTGLGSQLSVAVTLTSGVMSPLLTLMVTSPGTPAKTGGVLSPSAVH